MQCVLCHASAPSATGRHRLRRDPRLAQEAAAAKRGAEEARAQLGAEVERARAGVRAEQDQAALMQKLEQFNLLRESNATLRWVARSPRPARIRCRVCYVGGVGFGGTGPRRGRAGKPTARAGARAAWGQPGAVMGLLHLEGVSWAAGSAS